MSTKTKEQILLQAISDFDGIKAAIEESGVAVPYGTDTSEYDDLIRKAVSNGRGVFNAETHYDFPSVGSEDMIYKAQSEKLIYQWNSADLKYEPLGSSGEISVENIELINGGNANGNT